MGKINILMAEDHKVVRQGIRQFLEREPDIKVVGEASNGEEAVRLAEALKPDVVIMDIAMPKLNGIEATKQIKTLYPSVAVLILTTYDDNEYVLSFFKVGAAGYLLKTARGSELIAAIRALYAGEVILHPVIPHKIEQR